MAHYNSETKEMSLSHEDREAMRGVVRMDAEGVMNWIVSGNREGRLNLESNPPKIDKKEFVPLFDSNKYQFISSNYPSGYSEGNEIY